MNRQFGGGVQMCHVPGGGGIGEAMQIPCHYCFTFDASGNPEPFRDNNPIKSGQKSPGLNDKVTLGQQSPKTQQNNLQSPKPNNLQSYQPNSMQSPQINNQQSPQPNNLQSPQKNNAIQADKELSRQVQIGQPSAGQNILIRFGGQQQSPGQNNLTQFGQQPPVQNNPTQFNQQYPGNNNQTQLSQQYPRQNNPSALGQQYPGQNNSTQYNQQYPGQNNQSRFSQQYPGKNYPSQLTQQSCQQNNFKCSAASGDNQGRFPDQFQKNNIVYLCRNTNNTEVTKPQRTPTQNSNVGLTSQPKAKRGSKAPISPAGPLKGSSNQGQVNQQRNQAVTIFPAYFQPCYGFGDVNELNQFYDSRNKPAEPSKKPSKPLPAKQGNKARGRERKGRGGGQEESNKQQENQNWALDEDNWVKICTYAPAPVSTLGKGKGKKGEPEALTDSLRKQKQKGKKEELEMRPKWCK